MRPLKPREKEGSFDEGRRHRKPSTSYALSESDATDEDYLGPFGAPCALATELATLDNDVQKSKTPIDRDVDDDDDDDDDDDSSSEGGL